MTLRTAHATCALALVISVFSSTALAQKVEMPEQFKSTKAAVILGLENETKLDETMITKASRKLFSKYHPDHYPEKEYSKADRQTVTEIAQKIQEARDSLLDYIKFNPAFNPKAEAESGASTTSYGGKGQPYSWYDIFTEKDVQARGGGSSRTSSDLVTEGHYGDSLRGTMFEFLYQYPNLKQAFMPMAGKDTNVGDTKVDFLLIIDPAIFPSIEIKVLSKKRGGTEPQLVQSMFAKYVRGHHQGNSGRNLVDAIVLPNGHYLMNPMSTGRHAVPANVLPLDAAGERAMLTGKGLVFFLDMFPTGYSSGPIFSMMDKQPHEVLPMQKPQPQWKTLEIGTSKEAIRLGYTPSVKTCEALFQ